MNAQVLNVSRILASSAYILVIIFLVIINTFSSGVGLEKVTVCRGLIRSCLVFYGLIKLSLYLFMAERVHTVRSVELSRWQDRLWIATIALELLGLATVIGFALGTAGYSLESNGVCRVGVPNKATFAILAFDVPLNLWLIGCFIWFLRPTLRSGLHDTTQMSVLSRIVAGAPVSRAPGLNKEPAWASIDLESVLNSSYAPSMKRASELYTHAPSGKHPSVVKVTSLSLQPCDHGDQIQSLSVEQAPFPGALVSFQEKAGDEEVPGPDLDLAEMLRGPALHRHRQPSLARHPQSRRPSSLLGFMDILNDDTPSSPYATPTLQEYPNPQNPPVQKSPTPVLKRLESLIKRNLLGTLILFVPILINAGLYWVFHGRELAWICLLMCSLDVTSSIAVLHWLTASPEETA